MMPIFWHRLIPGILIVAGVTACNKEIETIGEPPIRPVKIYTVAEGDSSAIRNFPGRIEASQRAELAFRVSGSIEKIVVKEGDDVKKGQLLASLDATDFRITLEDRQATFDNAKRNYDRAEELVAEGAISKLDRDRMEANFKTSRAALSAAKQNLAYTQLKAPFAGQIARRHIDNFEEIKAKQQIFSLQNTDNLDVIINMPESIIKNLRKSEVDKRKNKTTIPIFAKFKDQSSNKFPLSIKEIATKADKDTQAFQIRLTMPAPSEFTVLPGMTTNVIIDFRTLSHNTSVFLVPASAIVSNTDLDTQIWVLDPDSMTVKSRSITIGRMTGTMIEINSGLVGNEEIISVGATYLAENMHVSRMIQTEQALPRADDPN